MPAAACNAQSAIAWHTRAPHCACFLWEGGASIKTFARARRVALVVVARRLQKGTAPARGLSLLRRRTVV